MIFVNDGSTDNTLQILELLNKNNPKIHYISFSRNFGQRNAQGAGIDYASGDCVISMDADLQHRPSLIRPMIDKWVEGYHIVYTVREEGNDVARPFYIVEEQDEFLNEENSKN